MKVTGPGAGQSGGPADISGPQAPAQTGEKPEIAGAGGSVGAGPAGAERLAKSGGVAQTAATATTATAAAAPPPGVVATHDIAAELKAGTLAPSAAMDKLIDRIVAQQLGPQAPAAVSDSLRAALRDAVDTDPMLAAKLRSLGSGQDG